MNLRIPLIDLIRGTHIHRKYEELLNIQGNDSLFNQKRNSHLVNLLISLRNYNNYYKHSLYEFSPSYIIQNPVDVLKTIPLINKEIINDNYSKILTPIKGHPTQKKKTGGSTGNPFYYHVDKEHLSYFWAHIYFFWNRYSGYELGDPFITVAGNSLRTVNKKISENIYHYLQNNYFIKGDVIDRTNRLNFHKIDKAVLLYGYPSSILSLIKIHPNLLEHTANLKSIFTTSEQLLPQSRIAIERSFGVPVYDMYGANDGGVLSCECTNHDGYHYNALNCFVENFENEYGMSELLLTNLNSHSFPFLRYRVGDLGLVDNSNCSCGLTWPRIINLKGRTRDLIRLPDGNWIHGSFFNNVFFKFPNVDGYRIVQEKDYSIEIYLHLKLVETSEAEFKKITNDINIEIKKNIGDTMVRFKRMETFNTTSEKFKLIESHVI